MEILLVEGTGPSWPQAPLNHMLTPNYMTSFSSLTSLPLEQVSPDATALFILSPTRSSPRHIFGMSVSVFPGELDHP